MSDTPLFSVVIPNWNGLKFLKVCLDALRAQTYPNIEVIIADNASTDGSQDFIRQNYPEVIVLDMGYNSGFTGACNAGMKHAKGEIISLLNNDTEVDSRWAEAVMDAFARHPKIGTVASKMLLFDKRDHIHTTGDYFTVDGRVGNRGVWEKDEGQYDHEDYVFSACGGSSAYRREMLNQIGLLDDDYFFSLEDIDLGWRAQLTGWQCLYTPRAIVYHHLSATGGGVTASFYDGRNGIFVLYKNYPKELWRKYRRAIIKRQWSKAWDAIRAWRGKASRAQLRGMLAGIFALPKLRKKRIAIQQGRVISIDALEAILTKLET